MWKRSRGNMCRSRGKVLLFQFIFSQQKILIIEVERWVGWGGCGRPLVCAFCRSLLVLTQDKLDSHTHISEKGELPLPSVADRPKMICKRKMEIVVENICKFPTFNWKMREIIQQQLRQPPTTNYG